MRAFIVRPFGKKQDIDFDLVEEKLFKPALKAVGITGATTAVIVEQGNIREDMFSLLLTADLVIADISIHNANVFYELGVRHALRDKHTFLLRSSKDEVPFDLKTDRYLSYSYDNLEESLENLKQALKDTIQSEKKDSPVFYTLPKLKAQDPECFITVPSDFGEAVELARATKQIGDLELLATETEGFSWEIPGLRVIGEAQFRLKAYESARISWEKVRDQYPTDLEANDRLCTIYHRLAEQETNHNEWLRLLTLSDQTVSRLLNLRQELDRDKLAEIYSLRARNHKAKWIDGWKDVSDENERQAKALRSSHLFNAYQDYEQGNEEDLNHFYSGVNALGLLTVLITLAERWPKVWELQFDTEEDAQDELKKHKKRYQKLVAIVEAAIEAERKRLSKEDKTDPWVEITYADLACLTFNKPERVANIYSIALEGIDAFNHEAVRRQLLIYDQLNVLSENVKEALAQFSEAEEPNVKKVNHYLLFTGHMIDKPDRKEPRFPPEQEENAREAIKQAVQKEKERVGEDIIGIAGGACGGDLLFHEVCEELEIDTELYLALPREQFIVESVQFAGRDWVDRFYKLYNKLPIQVLSQSKELPKWLQKKQNYSIWERNNLWMLHHVLALSGGIHATIIALWDGKKGDAAGGTEHMVEQARERGAKTVIIDTHKVFN